MYYKSCFVLITAAVLIISSTVAAKAADDCQGAGPQTPRDITENAGSNQSVFSLAPRSQKMNLCDIHFHKQAEHRSDDYSLSAGVFDFGGFRCNDTKKLKLAELTPLNENHCTNVAAGDTIEVHWVYTSCDFVPAPGLGSCLDFSEQSNCLNPNIRGEAQIFLLVNDKSAADFRDFDYRGPVDGDYHQPRSLPSKTGEPVEYLGSTTGPSFSNEVCSPLQVSWRVRPECAKLDIGSLSAWCQDNVFKENSGGGVRELVTDPRLLSQIK